MQTVPRKVDDRSNRLACQAPTPAFRQKLVGHLHVLTVMVTAEEDHSDEFPGGNFLNRPNQSVRARAKGGEGALREPPSVNATEKAPHLMVRVQFGDARKIALRKRRAYASLRRYCP